MDDGARLTYRTVHTVRRTPRTVFIFGFPKSGSGLPPNAVLNEIWMWTGDLAYYIIIIR